MMREAEETVGACNDHTTKLKFENVPTVVLLLFWARTCLESVKEGSLIGIVC